MATRILHVEANEDGTVGGTHRVLVDFVGAMPARTRQRIYVSFVGAATAHDGEYQAELEALARVSGYRRACVSQEGTVWTGGSGSDGPRGRGARENVLGLSA